MTEEAQSNPPAIVSEIHVGDAVWALTEQSAIFRNGRQVVIPHLGVDFMAELLAALSTPEFVGALNDNRIRMAEVENPVGRDFDPMEALVSRDCGANHEGMGAVCEKPFGHEGPHSMFMGGPADWGGGDDFEWNDEPPLVNRCGAIDDELLTICLLEDGHEGPHTEGISGHQWPNHRVKSTPRVDNSTNWEGFEVTQDDGHTAIVKHVGSDAEPWIFESAAEAEDVLRPGTHRSEYRRLCAKAYLVWHEQTFAIPMDWKAWMVGDICYSREGQKGIVFAHDGNPKMLVTQEGLVMELTEFNAEALSTWRVGIAASHDFNEVE